MARKVNGLATLGELMGKHGGNAQSGGLSMENIHDLLGHEMPSIDYTPLGRIRLSRALQRRFGSNYKNIPGISQIINDFENKYKLERLVREIKYTNRSDNKSRK